MWRGAPISRDLLHQILVVGPAAGAASTARDGICWSAPPACAAASKSLSVVLRSALGEARRLHAGMLFGLTGTAAGIAALEAHRLPSVSRRWCCRRAKDSDLELTASAAAISVFLGSLWTRRSPMTMV